MGSLKEVQFFGCLGHHGPYSFYKNVKIDGRVLGLSAFFPVRIFPDNAMFSIAEVQLLWSDRAENFVSLRLYFLPENTPEGRLRHHGEDEVIALQDKVIIRASDLSSWLVDESEWDWGYVLPHVTTSTVTKDSSPLTPPAEHAKRALSTDKFIKTEKNRDISEIGLSRVVVLNYQRYVRVRTLLKRLEGTEDMSNWLSDPFVLALGGLNNIGPHCRLLFSKEVFDYPELEDHELLCNHLAPKLKGRPRKRKRKRNRSVGSDSNKSSSSATSACSSEVIKKPLNGIIIIPVCPLELEEKPEVHCESPNYVGSEQSQPESPVEKFSSGKTETPFDEPTTAESGGPIESKIEPLSITSGVDSVIAEPPKNGQFHYQKSIKRKGSRLNQKLSPEEVVTRAVEPKIELESTTIKVTSSPPPVTTRLPVSTSPHPSAPGVNNKKDSEPCHTSTSPIVELLEPSLVELAEKLEKSNALHILPIRPSVITKKQDQSSCDMESSNNNGPSPTPSKKARTDPPKHSIPLSVTVSEVTFRPRKGSYSKIGATSVPQRCVSPEIYLGESSRPKPTPVAPVASLKSLPASWNKASVTLPAIQESNRNIQPAHQGSLTSASSNSKISTQESSHERTTLSITAIETDAWRKNAVYPMAWGSPSPFLPTRRIYGDPSHKVLLAMSRPKQQSNATPRSNGIPYPHTEIEGALDFSLKRRMLSSDSAFQSPSQTPIVDSNLDGECLDLSLHKSQPSSRPVYHAISDIPPPRAANNQGLRLTSEVTLFPQQTQKISRLAAPQSQGKRADKVKTPQNDKLGYSSPGSQPHHLDTNNFPNSAIPASRQQRHLPNEASYQVRSNSANNYNQFNPNPSVWKTTIPTSAVSTPGVGHGNSYSSSAVRTKSPRDSLPVPNRSLNNHHSNKQPKSSRTPSQSPVILDQRLPPSVYASVSPPKQSPSHSGRVLPPASPLANHHQQQRYPSDDARERNRSLNLDQFAAASPFGNFVLPTPPPVFPYSYANLDPSFFSSPFGSPFALNPNLMRLPPGAMESLQMAYMQQGMSPHLTNWGPPGKDPRNGSQK